MSGIGSNNNLNKVSEYKSTVKTDSTNKTLPSGKNESPGKKTGIETDRANIQLPFGTNPKTTSLSFVDENNELKPFESSGNLGSRLETLDKNISEAMKKAGTMIPPNAAKLIFETQTKLKNQLLGMIKEPKDLEKINQTLTSLVKQLKTYGLTDTETNKAIKDVTRALLDKVSNKFDLKLNIEEKNGTFIGLKAESTTEKKLSREQRKCFNELKDLCFQVERITAAGYKPLSPESIVLMGLRDELLRKSFDSITHPEEDVKGEPEYKDLGIISGAVATIDEMLSSSRDLPPEMVSDFSKTAMELINAPKGQAEEALSKLNLNNPSLNDAFNNLKNSLDSNSAAINDITAMKQVLHNSGITEGPAVNFLNDLGKQLGSGKTDPSAIDQLKKLLDENQKLKTPELIPPGNEKLPGNEDLNQSSAMLLNIIKDAPHDLGPDIKETIDSYSKSMDKVEKSLPPFLPFPVTMPVPMVYDDGDGNRFILQAGSQISQHGQGYTITTPGMLMETDGTLVQTNQAEIKIGNQLDRLSMGQLQVTDSNTDTLIKGFTAEIDRKNGTSFIKADSVSVDMTNGHVSLNNAAFFQNADGSFQLSASDLLYNKDGEHASMDGFQLGQTFSPDGTSTLSGSANALDMNMDGTVIKADNLSFNLTDNNTGTQTGRFAVQNMHVVNGENTINAASATFDVIANQDGSSSMVFQADSPSVKNADSLINIKGQATLSMLQDQNGNTTLINLKTDELNYQDNNGSVLNALNSDITVNYGENGKISSLSGKAESFGYTGKEGVINATGADLNLQYGENGLLQTFNAKADTFGYESESGKFDVIKGELALNFGENGKLQSVNGSADNLNWAGKAGDTINAENTGLTMNFYENGNLSDVASSVGSLDYKGAGGELVNVVNGKASLELSEEGIITKGSGSADQLNYSGLNGEQLKATGLELEFTGGENGIQNASIKTGTLDYLGANGEKLNLLNGSASLTRDAEGNITSLKAAADSVNFTGVNGENLKGTGISFEATGGKNGIESAKVEIGTLNYLSAKGENLSLTNASATLIRNEQGIIANLTAKGDSLDYTGINGENIKATDFDLNITNGENGLESADLKLGTLNYTGSQGEKFELSNGFASVARDEKGFISSLEAKGDTLDYTGINGENIKATDFDLKITGGENGLETADLKIGSLDYLGAKGGKLSLTGGNASLTRDVEGFITGLQASGDKLDYTGFNGENIKATDFSLNITGDKNGLNKADISLGTLDYLGVKGEKFNLSNGSASLNRDAEGFITSVTAKADSLSYTGVNGDQINASEFDMVITGGKNGLESADVKIGILDFMSAKGDKLNVTNGSASLTRDSEGYITKLSAGAEKIDFTAVNGDNIKAQDFNLMVNGGKNGIENARVDVGSLEYTSSKGETMNLTKGFAEFNRNSEGVITSVTGGAESLTFKGTKGEQVTASGLEISLTGDENGFSAGKVSAATLNFKNEAEKMTVDATNAVFQFNETQILVHVDSAEILQQLSEELKVKVENVDLIVDKNKDGGLKGLDLQLEGLDGTIKGMNVMVKTEDGQRVRLNVQVSDDGKMIQEAFLQIPAGGEIKIEKEDMKITLGPQMFKFSQDGEGRYTLRAEDININAVTKDAKVDVQGGTAEVMLDANTGDLIIQDITGVKVNAEVGEHKINIDLKELDGFLLKTTGISGLATGAIIHLQPTSDNSEMTATITANVKGVPITLDFKNLNELKIMGSYSENEVYIYAGDPTGKGEITLGAGDLKLYGSAIEFAGKYHEHDSQRMLSSLSRYISREGVKKGIFTVEPDSVLRVGTPWKNGPHGEIAFIMPRAWENQYNFPQGVGAKNGTFGAVVSAGWQGKTDSGTEWIGKVYGGAVDGSYVSLDMNQGSMTYKGIPLPKHYALPTTAIAGVGVSVHGEKTRVDATAGVFVNPAGFVGPELPIKEEIPYGAFAGVNVSREDTTFGIAGLANVVENKETGEKKIDPGIRISIGAKFDLKK